MDDNICLWLRMTLIFGVGNKRMWELSGGYSGIEEFSKAVRYHKVKEMTEAEYDKADNIPEDAAQKILELCDQRGIQYYSYESEGYPGGLRRIANPPAVLYFKGNLDFLNDKCVIAVVGTRSPSEYSLNVTDKLSEQLLQRGFLLCSGFAEGIDQRINSACIETGNFPIAVLGKEIDEDHPKGSRELKELIAKNGVVISEYYPKCKSGGNSFVNRNRISVGIAKGVLFIEARRESHGLNNYDHAIYQGKPVFVVPPHDIFDRRYFGQADLLRDGCVAACSADDIAYELINGSYENNSTLKSLGELNILSEDSVAFNRSSVKSRNRKKTISKSKAVSKTDDTNKPKKADIDYSDFDETQREICRLLEKRDMLADEIASELGQDISEVFALLTDMEMFGAVRSLPGNMFGL